MTSKQTGHNCLYFCMAVENIGSFMTIGCFITIEFHAEYLSQNNCAACDSIAVKFLFVYGSFPHFNVLHSNKTCIYTIVATDIISIVFCKKSVLNLSKMLLLSLCHYRQ